MMNESGFFALWMTLAIAFVAGIVLVIKPDARRTAVTVIVAAAFAVTLMLAYRVALPFAREHSTRDLLQTASERGYADAPIINFHTIERTSEFYGTGRTLYDAEVFCLSRLAQPTR